MNSRRIAVLVDGDNISPVHAKRLLDEGAKLGRVDIARVYVAGTHPSEWLSTAGYRAMHSGVGKNSTDILLSIDAIELALSHEIGNFVIATSDGDFSHVALRLRERGLHVAGFGETKAPQRFRKACSAFTVLNAATKLPTQAPPPAVCGVTELDKQIRAVIGNGSDEGRGIPIHRLAQDMRNLHGTLISKTPEKSWRGYLTKRTKLFNVDPRGPDAKVRYLMDGFATA